MEFPLTHISAQHHRLLAILYSLLIDKILLVQYFFSLYHLSFKFKLLLKMLSDALE